MSSDSAKLFQKVYPRVGGETRALSGALIPSGGLSPRGRGNRRQSLERADARGSIPAWAGKPRPAGATSDNGKVYPRVGGETRWARIAFALCAGLSPRGRGNPPRDRAAHAAGWSIPAWAGKPGPAPRRRGAEQVYPRVGGETSRYATVRRCCNGLSPRGRGNLPDADVGDAWARSIPAWAGKPDVLVGGDVLDRVYPRVGGETSGMVRDGRADVSAQGSIPAWAGKPASRPGRAGPKQVYPRVGGETRCLPS